LEDLDVVLWAVVAALAFAGEVLTVSFFLLFFALGALVALAMALLGASIPLQIGGFIAASVLSMVLLRPAVLNRISFRNSERYVGQSSIAGRSAVVTKAIEPGESGMVRVGGEFWTARSLYAAERIEPGEKVRVLDTEGVTALVEALESERREDR
jgi:membrane protein implicated in regulation of membrane protease activity